MNSRRRKVELIIFGIRTKWAWHKRYLGFEEILLCDTGLQFIPDFFAALFLAYCPLHSRLRNTSKAAFSSGRSKTSDLAAIMVNVLTPALSEESFIDRIAKATKAYKVPAIGTS